MPTLHFDKMPCDGQAQARATRLASRGVIGLSELLEDQIQVFLSDTLASVCNGDRDHIRLAGILCADHLRRDPYLTLTGELACVADQIGHDLAQPHLISPYFW